MLAIVRKELADYINSFRFMILFVLVLGLSALALYSASTGIRGTGNEGFIFLKLYTIEPQGISAPILQFLLNYVNFLPLVFIPLFGVLLGFDAINKERTNGTLSRIMSQPVYRDGVINGKFVASLIVLVVIMTTSIILIGGFGLRMIGIPPTSEEIIRIFLFLVFMIIYGAFWISLGILFSVIFRNLATSIICSLAVWLVFSFGVLIIANTVSKDAEMFQSILNYSPNWIFGQATSMILYPTARTLGTITESQASFMVPNPLTLGQSLLVVWPYIVGLVSLSAVCFGISYIVFMKQEIRAT
jgi:ABC-2 type transport system permease protein